MTSVDVMLWVDNQGKERNLNRRHIEKYILDKCGDTEHSRQMRMIGIARLAGNAQCRLLARKHRRLMKVLKNEYWGKIKYEKK